MDEVEEAVEHVEDVAEGRRDWLEFEVTRERLPVAPRMVDEQRDPSSASHGGEDEGDSLPPQLRLQACSRVRKRDSKIMKHQHPQA